MNHDPINHPRHYNSHPFGVECIDIIERLRFNAGSAIKYLWRAGLKDPSATIEDLRKAIWYVERDRAQQGKFLIGECKDTPLLMRVVRETPDGNIANAIAAIAAGDHRLARVYVEDAIMAREKVV